MKSFAYTLVLFSTSFRSFTIRLPLIDKGLISNAREGVGLSVLLLKYDAVEVVLGLLENLLLLSNVVVYRVSFLLHSFMLNLACTQKRRLFLTAVKILRSSWRLDRENVLLSHLNYCT